MLRMSKHSKIEIVASKEEEEEFSFVRLYILQFIYLYYYFITTFSRVCHLYLSSAR